MRQVELQDDSVPAAGRLPKKTAYSMFAGTPEQLTDEDQSFVCGLVNCSRRTAEQIAEAYAKYIEADCWRWQ